jgi:hypothetical protein
MFEMIVLAGRTTTDDQERQEASDRRGMPSLIFPLVLSVACQDGGAARQALAVFGIGSGVMGGSSID